jgi:hypothetical protein
VELKLGVLLVRPRGWVSRLFPFSNFSFQCLSYSCVSVVFRTTSSSSLDRFSRSFTVIFSLYIGHSLDAAQGSRSLRAGRVAWCQDATGKTLKSRMACVATEVVERGEQEHESIRDSVLATLRQQTLACVLRVDRDKSTPLPAFARWVTSPWWNRASSDGIYTGVSRHIDRHLPALIGGHVGAFLRLCRLLVSGSTENLCVLLLGRHGLAFGYVKDHLKSAFNVSKGAVKDMGAIIVLSHSEILAPLPEEPKPGERPLRMARHVH